MSNNRIDVAGTAAILSSVFVTSLIPLFLKFFTEYIDAWTANGLRYTTVAVMYLPWLLIAGKRGLLTGKTWRLALVPAGFNLLHQILWSFTPYFIDAGVMGFLIRLSTLWAIMGSFIFFRDERALVRSLYFWAGVVFNITGFSGIVLGGDALSGSTAIGILFILLCSILWAGYTVSVRHFFKKTDARTAFGMVAFLTYPGLLFLMLHAGRPAEVFSAPFYIMPMVVLSGVLGLGINHILIYTAIKRLGVSITTTIALSASFVTALLANFLLAESLTWYQWTGGAVLVMGSALLIRAQKDFPRRRIHDQDG